MKAATNSGTDNQILESALRYRNNYGFPVIPVEVTSDNKVPHVSWKKFQNQLPEGETIRDWWEKWPDAGVGIVTGKFSGLLVLDVDTDEGWKYVKETKRIGSEPTPIVKTGNGYHVYYRYPNQGIKNQVRIGKEKQGLDIRAEGGYVVAPPSLHYNEERYRWMHDFSNCELQEVPDWLLQKISQTEPREGNSSDLDEIKDGVPEGQRNDAATKMAGSLFNKYGTDSEELVWQELQDWNSNNTPPLDGSELATVFRSIKKREQESSDGEPKDGGQGNSSNSGKKSHLQLADEFMRKERENGRRWEYVPETGSFYWYKEGEGAWDKVDERYLKSEVRRFAVGVSAKLDKNHSIKEIISAMKDSLASPDNRKKLDPAVNPNTELINVENGMLDWKDQELKKHDSTHYSTLQLPIKYDPTAGYDRWEKTLREWIPQEDTRKFIQEFTGYMLVPDTSRQKSVILYGSGSNGKSTFLEVIGKLFGEENLTHVPLHRLANRFETGKLQGKLVNICPDIDSNYIDRTGLLKTLIAGETLRAEEKYKPSFDFHPIARLIFSANELPNASDKTEAWYRRFEFVEFPNSFKPGEEDYDPNLKEKLTDELSGIFNWALEGLYRLEENGGFTISSDMKRSKERYRSVNDSVNYFYDENISEVPNDEFLPTQFLYGRYKTFCEDTGMNTVSMKKFSKRMKELGLQGARRRVEVCKQHSRFRCDECEEFEDTNENLKRGFIDLELLM